MKATSLRRITGLLCVAMAAALLIVGWWPFSFHPTNKVSWLADHAGLQFRPSAIVYDPEPLPATLQARPADQPATYTIELWLKAELEPSDNAYHILTIDDGHLPSNFVLCQWKSFLLHRTPARESKRGFREVDAESLKKLQTRFITIVGDAGGTTFYENGILAERYPDFVVPARRLSGQLILGNSAEGKHSWTGQLFGLAIFNRALDATTVAQHYTVWTNQVAKELAGEPGLTALYLFDQRNGQSVEDISPNRHRLFIPSHYQVLQKIVLALPWDKERLDWSDLDDILINIFGFLPFGLCVFFFFWLTSPNRTFRNSLFTVTIGAAISLPIELVQVWLPNRSSSATDLVCNIGGTFLGVCAVRIVLSKITATKLGSEM